MLPPRFRSFNLLNIVCLLVVGVSAAAEEAALPPIPVTQTSGQIKIDGDLTDPGWQTATRIETWFEVNPGDNVPPPVKNVGFLTYDDKYFYAAFDFEDPDPGKIRAPLGDHDNVPGYTDYGGVILDTRNNEKTGILFLANARGIQYDAVSDDASGEDSSPDYFWDAVGRINEKGWTLELRIPFSSLRYPKTDPQTWGIMLYRNYPRDFRRQFFSTRLPRGGSCFICRENKLSGLTGLPSGGHVVVAPYAAGRQTARPRGDVTGAPLENDPFDGDVGLDVKWTPGANTAVDATLNPDFSQIESDVAQIVANERFALFFSEKRPFFLEGIELFATPIQAVYTRTITSPRWGLRGTGKLGATAYTGLVAFDRGGGSVILPGANSSDFADQEFESLVAVGRLRCELGRSSVSLLMTDREISGGGSNLVFGPDFQWRAGQKDTITGQLLWSRSETPVRTTLADEWDGRRLSGHAADAWWSHSTKTIDWFGEYKDFGEGFRADGGFVPQVGFRQTYAEAGYTFRPTGLLSRLRTFAIFDRSAERDGGLLNRSFSFGTGMDGRWSSFFRVRYAFDRVRAGETTLPRQQLLYTLQFSPSRQISQLVLEGFVGEDVDFEGARVGRGARISLSAALRPTDHLELRLDEARRWLNLDAGRGRRERLFNASVDRLRATYTFTSRCFLRGIVQWVETKRDPALFADTVEKREGSLSTSALLAYKLNWQTVLFLGYGDARTLTENEVLAKADRQFFVKLSYAFQR
jgi:hypothetical protein